MSNDRKDSNVFISYPRSGSHWIKARMRMILSMHHGGGNVSEPSGWFNWTHYGYAFHPSLNVPSRKVVPHPRSSIVILLRDAKATLGSYYYHMLTRYTPLAKIDTTVHIEKDPDLFIKGPQGVQRFCEFANEVADLCDQAERMKWTIRVVYYEDLFSDKAVREIASLLGEQYLLDPATEDRIFESTRGLVNPSLKVQKGTLATRDYQATKHNDAINSDLRNYIDGYLREHCNLKPYRARYLEG